MTQSAAEYDQLETAFLETALRRVDLLRMNEPKKANREYDKLHEIKNRLRMTPDKGEAALKRIALNVNLEVKILAAASLLAVDEQFAIVLLEKIASSQAGLSSFTAEMTIREWRSGTIRAYWS